MTECFLQSFDVIVVDLFDSTFTLITLGTKNAESLTTVARLELASFLQHSDEAMIAMLVAQYIAFQKRKTGVGGFGEYMVKSMARPNTTMNMNSHK